MRLIILLIIQLFVFSNLGLQDAFALAPKTNLIEVSAIMAGDEEKMVGGLEKDQKNENIDEIIRDYMKGKKVKDKTKHLHAKLPSDSGILEIFKPENFRRGSYIWIAVELIVAIIGFGLVIYVVASLIVMSAWIVSIFIFIGIFLFCLLFRHVFDSYEMEQSRKPELNQRVLANPRLISSLMILNDILLVVSSGLLLAQILAVIFFILGSLWGVIIVAFALLFLGGLLLIKHYNMLQKGRTLYTNMQMFSAFGNLDFLGIAEGVLHLSATEQRDDSQNDGYRRIILYRNEAELLKKMHSDLDVSYGKVYCVSEEKYNNTKNRGLIIFGIFSPIVLLTVVLSILFIPLGFIWIAGIILGVICAVWYVIFIWNKYSLFYDHLKDKDTYLEEEDDVFLEKIFNLNDEPGMKAVFAKLDSSRILMGLKNEQYEELVEYLSAHTGDEKVIKDIIRRVRLHEAVNEGLDVNSRRGAAKRISQAHIVKSYSQVSLTPFPAIPAQGPVVFDERDLSLDPEFMKLKEGIVVEIDQTGAQNTIATHKWAAGRITLAKGFVKYANREYAGKASNAITAAVQTELLQIKYEARVEKPKTEMEFGEYEAGTLIISWAHTSKNKLEAYRDVLQGYGKSLGIADEKIINGIKSYLEILNFVINNYSILRPKLVIEDDVDFDRIQSVLTDIELDSAVSGKVDIVGNINNLKIMAAA